MSDFATAIQILLRPEDQDDPRGMLAALTLQLRDHTLLREVQRELTYCRQQALVQQALAALEVSVENDDHELAYARRNHELAYSKRNEALALLRAWKKLSEDPFDAESVKLARTSL